MLETKSIAALAFTETPRKRKRETLSGNAAPPPNPQQQPLGKDAQVSHIHAQDAAVASATESCFTNAAFSSTPKKLMIGRRRLAKENSNPHPNPFPGLEVKSIADLAQKQLPTNPFEVLRQPPKKKKREQLACFENPGLNLELPEKQFNPYEVVRLAATPAKGFVNPGLNLRGSDAPASLNPFEIHRPSEASEAACNPSGVANPALAERDAEEPLPTSLKIGLPFTPTLGCRIDFHGMSLAQLTPSKLLAEKLVFSPVPAPKRSLGAISEESSMDIGKELDRYQLELENSINEAKLRKNGVQVDREVPRNSLEVELPKNTKVSLVMETDSQELMMQEVAQGDSQVERRLVCTRRRTLTEITETPEVEEEKKDLEAEKLREQERILEQEMQLEKERHLAREKQLEQEKLLEREKHLEREKLQEKLHEQLREKLQERVKLLEKEKLEEEELLEKQLQEQRNLEAQQEPPAEDVAYASDESEDEPDDLDFKAPTRFVRAYRPAALPTKAASKESLHSIGSSKSSKSAEVKPSGGMKGMIRKSIRRLMHPTHTSPEKTEDKDADAPGHHHNNILHSIRHSLRRRPQKAAEVDNQMEPVLADISIIDTSERTMKLRSNVAQTEYMTIEQLTNEKKHTLRNSIRRSTRDVLRHVFHKSHDAYATAK
ncbi:trichohyalin [Drosophila subpulchrella]|uniref:trichohyalin n=1 Tax=Drosophila subpulchrella TaxID=1486046 RepID=UPI0018A172C6|nr:trichohyalin [Drosophila subpulchrella]